LIACAPFVEAAHAELVAAGKDNITASVIADDAAILCVE